MNFFKRFFLFLILISTAFLAGIGFSFYARGQIEKNAGAENRFVAIFKNAPTIDLIDYQDGENDLSDIIQPTIYCNANYDRVELVVNLYDNYNNLFQTYQVVFENCKKGETYVENIDLPPSISLKCKDMGIRLISYK